MYKCHVPTTRSCTRVSLYFFARAYVYVGWWAIVCVVCHCVQCKHTFTIKAFNVLWARTIIKMLALTFQSMHIYYVCIMYAPPPSKYKQNRESVQDENETATTHYILIICTKSRENEFKIKTVTKWNTHKSETKSWKEPVVIDFGFGGPRFICVI